MFLGIDMGTSEVKALLLEDSHRIVGSAGVALTVSRPHPGHSEQHPQDWWAATQAALAQLRLAHPREYAAVRGIGLSGQMHGAVLLDAHDQVLRPAILWNDTRSASECTEMMAERPSLTAPKLRWVARHEPHIFQRLAKVLLPKDYVRLMLTGDHVSDLSKAAQRVARAWPGWPAAVIGLPCAAARTLRHGSRPTPPNRRCWPLATPDSVDSTRPHKQAHATKLIAACAGSTGASSPFHFTGIIRCWYGVPGHITYGAEVSGSALLGYMS